jgi:hypothetical protein
VRAGGDKAGGKPGGVAPTFTQKPIVTQEGGGTHLVIICQCQAAPEPTVYWMKGTKRIVASTRIIPTKVGDGNTYTLKLEIKVSLYIRMVPLTEASGFYLCKIFKLVSRLVSAE